MQNPQDTEKLNSHTSKNSVSQKSAGSCSNGFPELGPSPLGLREPSLAEEILVAHTFILGVTLLLCMEKGRVELYMVILCYSNESLEMITKGKIRKYAS